MPGTIQIEEVTLAQNTGTFQESDVFAAICPACGERFYSSAAENLARCYNCSNAMIAELLDAGKLVRIVQHGRLQVRRYPFACREPLFAALPAPSAEGPSDTPEEASLV